MGCRQIGVLSLHSEMPTSAGEGVRSPGGKLGGWTSDGHLGQGGDTRDHTGPFNAAKEGGGQTAGWDAGA